MGLKKIASLFLVFCSTTICLPAAETKPNIILIVADDLGYADLNCHGGKDISTPHLDALAKSGIRCTSGYVSGPVCSPARAGFLTGRYQQRFGHEFNPGSAPKDSPAIGLPLTEKTLADYLKQAGYRTGLIGKWHLGSTPELHPQRRGFDEFFGFLGGAHSYFGNAGILRGTEPILEKEYLTDAFERETLAFIDRNQEKPFFLYLSFNAVHTPMHAVDEDEARFPNVLDPMRRKLAAMLVSMDDAVGALMKKLTATGQRENTLIFFISDNGGPTQANTSSNKPFRGEKGKVLEGGVRVPFFVSWPKQLPAGKTYDLPVSALDILPTALAAAGQPLPEKRNLDGVNLLPYLRKKNKTAPHEFLFWRFGPQRAVRSGDWKLMQDENGVRHLYNLKTDVGESKNLIEKNVSTAKKLQAAYDAWDAEMITPLWGKAVSAYYGGNTAPKKAKRP